jgi:serine/threonine-protein phosphatase PGAM5
MNGPFPRSRDAASPVTWNENWDFRQNDSAAQKVLPHFSQKDQPKTKGIHQIILVRHGQYDNKHEFDHEHVLTELGKAQATLTGKRLNELIEAGIVYKINNIFYSTMKRATETWEAIQPELAKDNYLPTNHHIQACSMIREGAVSPPVPPSVLWTPSEEVFLKDQQRVSFFILFFFFFRSSLGS